MRMLTTIKRNIASAVAALHRSRCDTFVKARLSTSALVERSLKILEVFNEPKKKYRNKKGSHVLHLTNTFRKSLLEQDKYHRVFYDHNKVKRQESIDLNVQEKHVDIFNSLKDLISNKFYAKDEEMQHEFSELESQFSRIIRCLEVDEHLLLLDMFHVSGHRPYHFLQKLLKLYECDWENLSLSSTQLIPLLLHIAHSRDSPVIIMKQIQNCLYENHSQLNAVDAATICNSFFVTNTRITDFRLLRKIDEMTRAGMLEGTITPNFLLSAIKAFKHAGYNDINFYKALGDYLRTGDNSRKLTVPGYKTILAAFYTAKIADFELFEEMLHNLRWLIGVIKKAGRSIRVKDIAEILKFHVVFGIQVPDWLTEMLVDEINIASKEQDWQETIVGGVQDLCLAGVYSNQLLNIVLDPSFVNRKLAGRIPQFSNLLLIDTATDIENPTYDGPRLEQAFFTALPKYEKGNLGFQLMTNEGLAATLFGVSDLLGPSKVKCHFLLQYSRLADIEVHLDNRGRALAIPDTEEVNDDDDGSGAILKMRRNLDYATNEDSKEGESIIGGVLSEFHGSHSLSEYRQEPFQPVTYHFPQKSMDTARRKIVIRVMGYNQYLKNYPYLTGTHQAEIRMLLNLGYEVILLSPDTAKKIHNMSLENRCNFVRNYLLTDTFRTNPRCL